MKLNLEKADSDSSQPLQNSDVDSTFKIEDGGARIISGIRYSRSETSFRKGTFAKVFELEPDDHKHTSPRYLEITPSDPQNPHIEEAKRKQTFFNLLYSVNCPFQIAEATGLYTLIVPKFEGEHLDYKVTAANLIIALLLFYQLALAIEKAHQKRIVYNDLKGDNAIVDEKGEVKLIDGGSYAIEDEVCFFTRQGNQDSHFAPELFDTNNHAKKESDIYSFGKLVDKALKKKTSALSETTATTINQCLDSNLAVRPTLGTIKEVFHAEIIRLNCEFLKNLKAALEGYKPTYKWSPTYYDNARGKLVFDFRGYRKFKAKQQALKLIGEFEQATNNFHDRPESETAIHEIHKTLQRILYETFYSDVTNSLKCGKRSQFFAVLENTYKPYNEEGFKEHYPATIKHLLHRNSF